MGSEYVNENQEEKISLPSELQKQMMDFFLKTSIPRRKQEKVNLLSEKRVINPKSDRSDEE